MLKEGTTLQGRYVITQLLGLGGMGAVYQAFDKKMDEPIAIKEILFDFPDEAVIKSTLSAFEREARSLARARHIAIPFVKDFFPEKDSQFMVMELIEGDDLDEILKKHKKTLSLKHVLNWANQILDALVYLHKLSPPIIHRDIKPSNLKLSSNGQITLLDFGIAKNIENKTNSQFSPKTFVAATEEYSPLEQLFHTLPQANREYFLLKHKKITEDLLKMKTDARSDIYSLGATLYHLLTNQTPIDSVKRALELLEGKPDPLIPPAKLNPYIPKAISNWILKAMSIERKNRFESAYKMKATLGKILSTTESERVLNDPAFSIKSPREISVFETSTYKTELTKKEVSKTNPNLNQNKKATLTSVVNNKTFWVYTISIFSSIMLLFLSIGFFLLVNNLGQISSTKIKNISVQPIKTITPQQKSDKINSTQTTVK